VGDEEKGLKQKLLQIDNAIKTFIHKTSPIDVAPVTYASGNK
jgi:hypothetical protein